MVPSGFWITCDICDILEPGIQLFIVDAEPKVAGPDTVQAPVLALFDRNEFFVHGVHAGFEPCSLLAPVGGPHSPRALGHK